MEGQSTFQRNVWGAINFICGKEPHSFLFGKICKTIKTTFYIFNVPFLLHSFKRLLSNFGNANAISTSDRIGILAKWFRNWMYMSSELDVKNNIFLRWKQIIMTVINCSNFFLIQEWETVGETHNHSVINCFAINRKRSQKSLRDQFFESIAHDQTIGAQ